MIITHHDSACAFVKAASAQGDDVSASHATRGVTTFTPRVHELITYLIRAAIIEGRRLPIELTHKRCLG